MKTTEGASFAKTENIVSAEMIEKRRAAPTNPREIEYQPIILRNASSLA